MRARVLAQLRKMGPTNAVRLRQSLGIGHEDVYRALAGLEALGLAEMVGTRDQRTIKWKAKSAVQITETRACA